MQCKLNFPSWNAENCSDLHSDLHFNVSTYISEIFPFSADFSSFNCAQQKSKILIWIYCTATECHTRVYQDKVAQNCQFSSLVRYSWTKFGEICRPKWLEFSGVHITEKKYARNFLICECRSWKIRNKWRSDLWCYCRVVFAKFLSQPKVPRAFERFEKCLPDPANRSDYWSSAENLLIVVLTTRSSNNQCLVVILGIYLRSYSIMYLNCLQIITECNVRPPAPPAPPSR